MCIVRAFALYPKAEGRHGRARKRIERFIARAFCWFTGIDIPVLADLDVQPRFACGWFHRFGHSDRFRHPGLRKNTFHPPCPWPVPALGRRGWRRIGNRGRRRHNTGLAENPFNQKANPSRYRNAIAIQCVTKPGARPNRVACCSIQPDIPCRFSNSASDRLSVRTDSDGDAAGPLLALPSCSFGIVSTTDQGGLAKIWPSYAALFETVQRREPSRSAGDCLLRFSGILPRCSFGCSKANHTGKQYRRCYTHQGIPCLKTHKAY